MNAPLSLANVLTVLVGISCLWTIVNQSLGGIAKLWRLAVPPCLAIVVAMVLLAGVVDPSWAHDAEWVVGGFVGWLAGRSRGWSVDVQVDQMSGLVRLRPSLDGLLAAFGLLALTLIDFVSAAREEPLIDASHVAAAAALCAGFIAGRAIAVAVRAGRAPHVQLHDA